MKRNLIALVIGLFLTFSLSAQVADTISYTKVFGGFKYSKGNEILSLKKINVLVKEDPKAYAYMKKAVVGSSIAQVFGGIGGGLIGYTLGTAAGGGDAEWSIALVGCGFIVVALPLAHSADKNVLKAVQTYNRGIKPISSINSYNLKLTATTSGIGLRLTF
jgi:hypothetical protein